MNIKQKSLVAGVLGAIALSASVTLAVAPTMTFTNLRGSVHVRQGVPCGDPVDVTTSIADGRMDIVPSAAPRVPTDAIGNTIDTGGVQFDLVRLDLFLSPFTVQRECLGFTATADFRQIGVQLVNSVRFAGVPIGTSPEDRKYSFTIPRSQVLLFESVSDNLPVQQPEVRYQRPSEDVTGEIDLRRHTATLHVALSDQLRFRAGCVGKKCAIDQTFGGVTTTDVGGMMVSPGLDSDGDGVPNLNDNCPLVPNAGQELVPAVRFDPPAPIAPVTVSSCAAHDISVHAVDVCHARPVVVTSNAPAKFAVGRNVIMWQANDGIDPPISAPQVVTVSADDHMPPVVACTVGKSPQFFTVTAVDDCAGPTTLKLGSFSLANGETIQIEQTGKPGVRLINTTSNDNVKHFQVGKGEALIVATDASGNVNRAGCAMPLDITTDITTKKK